MAKFINNRNWMLKVFPRSGGGTPLKGSDLKKPVAQTTTNAQSSGSVV
jgi:hypothetical protein